MSNWRAMLKEAKELFEDGLLDESEYKAEKARIMTLRSQGASETPSTNAADLSGETQMFTGTESITVSSALIH